MDFKFEWIEKDLVDIRGNFFNSPIEAQPSSRISSQRTNMFQFPQIPPLKRGYFQPERIKKKQISSNF